jgi:hypothetical protein
VSIRLLLKNEYEVANKCLHVFGVANGLKISKRCGLTFNGASLITLERHLSGGKK